MSLLISEILPIRHGSLQQFIPLGEQIKKSSRFQCQHAQKAFQNTCFSTSGILAYFDFDGLSTWPLEGTNNKIKTVHKIAYGFRDNEFFKLKTIVLRRSGRLSPYVRTSRMNRKLCEQLRLKPFFA